MSEDQLNARSGHTDIAALSAGVIAVVVSLFVSPGAYGGTSLVVTLTLIVIILGYVWASKRRWLQTLAVAAAIGLASIPGIGFIDEAARSRSPIGYLMLNESWDCNEDPCNEDGDRQSRVPDRDLVIGWLAVLVLTFAVDLVSQRRRWRR